MKRVLIAITTAETVCHETMESIYNLKVPEDVETVLRIIHSYDVSNGRNDLVHIMYQENCDFIFFVDSDVVLPDNALVDLYNMKWYMSVGTYPRKEQQTIDTVDAYTTLYWHHEENKTVFNPYFLPVSQLHPGYITPVDCCGLGCALISRELFDKLPEPWFVFVHEGDLGEAKTERSGYCIGEDMYFCRNVIQKAGIQIWAHGSVICGHIGKYCYRFKDWDQIHPPVQQPQPEGEVKEIEPEVGATTE